MFSVAIHFQMLIVLWFSICIALAHVGKGGQIELHFTNTYDRETSLVKF